VLGAYLGKAIQEVLVDVASVEEGSVVAHFCLRVRPRITTIFLVLRVFAPAVGLIYLYEAKALVVVHLAAVVGSSIPEPLSSSNIGIVAALLGVPFEANKVQSINKQV
jgi:hypothetical protein